MEGEIEQGGGEGEVVDLGGGEGTTEPQAGGQGAGAGTGTQPPPQARVFTQQEVNTIVQNRLAEEQRRNAARVAAEAQQRTQPQRETPPQNGFDDNTRAALDAYLEAQLTPLRAQAVKGEINTSMSEFQAKHPEFADQQVKDAVINTILSWGEEFVQRTPMDWLLEHGWLAYKYGAFDEKTFKEAAVQEYLASKGTKARAVPNAQGSGGKATTTPKPRGKEWKDADAAMRALIDEENAARA